MSYVIGAVLIVIGAAQIFLRGRIASANAASNGVMFNGRLAGPGTRSAMRFGAIAAGVIFIVVGLILVIAHPGLHHSHG